MKYIEAVDQEWTGTPGIGLFLAGGITGCPDWQADMAALLNDTDLTLLNPRRKSFNTADPTESIRQIQWERRHINRAHAVLFWFPLETLCPITLFELGTVLESDKAIFVGAHPKYLRRLDLEIQIPLLNPDIVLCDSLEALADQVKSAELERNLIHFG